MRTNLRTSRTHLVGLGDFNNNKIGDPGLEDELQEQLNALGLDDVHVVPRTRVLYCVLCCAVLCCGMLCCVVLCCGVVCCVLCVVYCVSCVVCRVLCVVSVLCWVVNVWFVTDFGSML